MKLMRSGKAWLKSDSDPRWNITISCRVGGLKMPKDLKKELEKLKEKFGNPPKNLEWGYMKDSLKI